MDPIPRLLRKADVEVLLAAIDGPAASVLEEITVVRHGVTAALGVVFGRPDERDWTVLLRAAAERGGWSASRRAMLAQADAPERAPDPEAVLDALWDLVRELNELRTIAPAPTDQ